MPVFGDSARCHPQNCSFRVILNRRAQRQIFKQKITEHKGGFCSCALGNRESRAINREVFESSMDADFSELSAVGQGRLLTVQSGLLLAFTDCGLRASSIVLSLALSRNRSGLSVFHADSPAAPCTETMPKLVAASHLSRCAFGCAPSGYWRGKVSPSKGYPASSQSAIPPA
jgi:hypothetical protein